MKRILIASVVAFLCCGPVWGQETAPVPTEVSPDTVRTLLIQKVAPIYPPLARQARIQGTVMLKVIINKAGEIQSAQLVSGHPMLAPAAMAAVKQWKYQPYMLNGEPVAVETTLQVNFRLEGGPAPQGGVVGSVPGGLPSGAIGSVMSSAVLISEAEMETIRTVKVDPIYPPAAIQQGIQGVVELELRINPSGDVDRVTLISGHPILAPAAIEAVKQWKYKPYQLNGSPATVETTVRMNFTLPGEIAPSDDALRGVSKNADKNTPGANLPQRVRVSQGVESGLIRSRFHPAYPQEAKDRHVEGTVLLSVKIDKEGNVNHVELISGHPLLAPAAIEAVEQWKYKPYLLNGNPVEVETQVQVNFVLAR
jgi:TonB family protein